MKVINGNIYKNGSFQSGTLLTKDGLISDSDYDGEIVDAHGCYVIPGFVDIHTHGAAGHDFCDASVLGLEKIAEFEKTQGVTSFCPTSMTLDEERLFKIFDSAKNCRHSEKQARIIGINMEGPFIAQGKKGAQNGKYIRNPDCSMFERLYDAAGGLVKLITIAPERSGSKEFINRYHDRVHISIGHTEADYDIAFTAMMAGVKHVTHLCNAMPPLAHREPGVIGAAADVKDVYVEVICDLIHIHPSMIRRIYDMFGPERICLISDSMEAAGMPDGEYELGGQTVYKKGRHATLADGTLAGSASSLYDCFRCAVNTGIPLADAVRMATYNPAKSIDMEKQVGNFTAGAYADLVILDNELNIVQVM